MNSTEKLFRAAMQNPGMRIKLPSYGQAVSARQRLNKWRKDYNKRIDKQFAGVDENLVPPRPFDSIQIDLVRLDGTPITKTSDVVSGQELFVVFNQRIELRSEILDANGNPIDLDEFGLDIAEDDLPPFPPSLEGLNLNIDEED